MGRRNKAETPDHSGGVRATAREQGQTTQLEKPSLSQGEIPGGSSAL
jgi:hypothetical protein